MLITPRYDVQKMANEMIRRGWNPTELGRRARVDRTTVSRFFEETVQTAKTAKRLAKALGQKDAGPYLLPAVSTAPHAQSPSAVQRAPRPILRSASYRKVAKARTKAAVPSGDSKAAR